jgi:uncharacterized phage infection (PIP) family protein YhgE
MTNMSRHILAPTAGIGLLVFAVGCTDREREQVQDEAAVSATEFRATMNDLRLDLRSTLDRFGSQIADLDDRYQSANEAMAAKWQETRDEIRQYRQELEADLVQLESATADDADLLRDDIANGLEELTLRVERAELQSVENAHEFVAASGEKLTRLDQEFRELERQTVALSMERREEASETMQDFSERAGELRTQLGSLVDASAEEISDEREEIAEGISSLTASVKRELFELRQSVTMTSMRN